MIIFVESAAVIRACHLAMSSISVNPDVDENLFLLPSSAVSR
jgi:hypothetical protein